MPRCLLRPNILRNGTATYGGLADKIEGAVIPTDKPDVFNFTRYEPLGVMAMITRGIRRI